VSLTPQVPWGLQQGIAYVSGLLDWPEQLQELTGLALLLGLPVAATLAWYHGDKGRQRVSRGELAILALLVLVGGGLFWYYQRTSVTPDTQARIPSAHQSTATPAALPDDRSIAVLPFVNMSADKEQEYFADGISEELLNLLAQVPMLLTRLPMRYFSGHERRTASSRHRPSCRQSTCTNSPSLWTPITRRRKLAWVGFRPTTTVTSPKERDTFSVRSR
jgi:hypothetical protein